MSTAMNMALMVVAMPLVFILMAMRAQIRIWAVMTGSCWLPYAQEAEPTKSWDVVKTLELSQFTSELEMGNVYMYVTIFIFGRLCIFFLQDAPKEYQFALKLAGLQGVYLYVIIGAFRALGNLAVAVLATTESYAYVSAVIRDKALTQLAPVFTVATLLCVYNMMVLSKMSDIKKYLVSPNLKFQATRALVLIAQIQLQVLTGLTVGSSMYLAVQSLPEKFPQFADKIPDVDNWHLSLPRAQLWHTSLLQFECLLVVLVNRCVWHASTDYADPKPQNVAVSDGPLGEKLLSKAKAGEA